MLLSSLLLLAISQLVHVASVPITHDDHDHSHVERRQLPTEWFQQQNHAVHRLFGRAPGDGTTRPDVGSPAWSAPYPRGRPDISQLPAAWVSALNAAVTAGKIPDIPQSTNTPQTNPVYPAGVNPNSPDVCSATYKCKNPEDIWDAPDGVFASSFDDGPYPTTTALVDFLTSNNVKTTHFMIGINILNNPQQFLHAFDAGNDIAVHTWNHLYMTTLSNLDIVGQLGWTMQIIHESTGGRVPRYWRPPYGDSDNRVRAIAKEVFGMDTVIWNQDTADWTLGVGPTTQDSIHTQMEHWLAGPKSPGLVILEHEISEGSVNAFIAAFPLIAQNGWKFQSLASTFGDSVYQNAETSSSNDVKNATIVAGPGDDDDDDDDDEDDMTSSVLTSTSTEGAPSPTAPAEQSAATSNIPKSSGVVMKLPPFWTMSIGLCGLLAGSLL